MHELKLVIAYLNELIQGLGCSKPEHQKQIEELQAAMQKVKDLADEMVE